MDIGPPSSLHGNVGRIAHPGLARTLRGPAAPADPQAAERQEVARGFEMLMLRMMLRAMRKTVQSGGVFPQSTETDIYADLMDEALAEAVAQRGTLGVAAQIERSLERMEAGGRRLPVVPEWRPLYENPALLPTSGALPPGPVSAVPRPFSLETIIDEAAQAHGVDSLLIAAVIQQESGGDPRAVSPAGAKGLMQLMDGTAREVGVRDVFDPRANVLGGTAYLRRMLDRHGGDLRLALAAYNAGPTAVHRYGDVPPFPETRRFVEQVLSRQARLTEARSLKGAF